MADVFLKILSMSLTASYCIILICVARLLLKKCPKVFSYMLWGIVAIRLMCPVEIESRFSLISKPVKNLSEFLVEDTEQTIKLPDNSLTRNVAANYLHVLVNAFDDDYYQRLTSETLSVNELQLSEGVSINEKSPEEFQTISNAGNWVDNETYPLETYTDRDFQIKQPAVSRGTLNIASITAFIKNIFLSNFRVFAMAYVWFTVALGLLIYNIFSYCQIRIKLKKRAVYDSLYKGIPTYAVESLETPFVLGIHKTAIYLPQALTGKEREYCLAHEYAHICRRDYLIKQCAFLFVCIHWFNPFMWLAFHLMTKDMEMSCDEVILKNATLQERKTYSKVLLQLACHKQAFIGATPSFSRDNVSSRIKNVLNLRKRSKWGVMFSIVVIIVCAAGMLTDPVNQHMSLSKSVSYAVSSDMNTAKDITDSSISDLQQAKDSAITAKIINSMNDEHSLNSMNSRNLYAIAVLSDDSETNTNTAKSKTKTDTKIKVLTQPIDSSRKIVETLTPGDKVQILSIGSSLVEDGMAYGDFQDIIPTFSNYKYYSTVQAAMNFQNKVPSSFNYAMILFNDSEGVQKRGYVKTDNLNLELADNTMDAYAYWTAKVWCDYFCRKNHTTMSSLSSMNATEYGEYIKTSEAFDYVDNPRSYPWKGYYIAMESDRDILKKDEVKVKLYYFEESSKPEMTVWRQDLMLQTDKMQGLSSIDELLFGGTVSFSVEKRCGDKISSYEEFKDIYMPYEDAYCFSYFNYENEIFQFYASTRQDMTFRQPELALRHYLHLEKDVLMEEEESGKYETVGENKGYDAYTKIKCTFSDDVSLVFPMYQKMGIWYIDSDTL